MYILDIIGEQKVSCYVVLGTKLGKSGSLLRTCYDPSQFLDSTFLRPLNSPVAAAAPRVNTLFTADHS